jgi:hypothetical protein
MQNRNKTHNLTFTTKKTLRLELLWDGTQRRSVVCHRRFGTTYRCHLQGSSSPRRLLGTLLVCSNTGNGVGGDWFSENVMLANRVGGTWRRWRGGKMCFLGDAPRFSEKQSPPPKQLHTQILPAFFLDCLALEDGTDRLTRNVGTYTFILRKIP